MSDERSDAERFYDEEIAPALLEIGRKCEERGMSVVFLVEYEPGEIGETRRLLPGAARTLTAASRQFAGPSMLAITTRNGDGQVISKEIIASV
jgi:hypothetical protein